jgi:hypothetical protein
MAVDPLGLFGARAPSGALRPIPPEAMMLTLGIPTLGARERITDPCGAVVIRIRGPNKNG